MYRQYILGEDKYVELEIRCRQKDATVVIPEATWELFRASKDVPESTGSCEIDRQYIRALIEPGERGTNTADYHVFHPAGNPQSGGGSECHLRLSAPAWNRPRW